MRKMKYYAGVEMTQKRKNYLPFFELILEGWFKGTENSAHPCATSYSTYL